MISKPYVYRYISDISPSTFGSNGLSDIRTLSTNLPLIVGRDLVSVQTQWDSYQLMNVRTHLTQLQGGVNPEDAVLYIAKDNNTQIPSSIEELLRMDCVTCVPCKELRNGPVLLSDGRTYPEIGSGTVNQESAGYWIQTNATPQIHHVFDAGVQAVGQTPADLPVYSVLVEATVRFRGHQ